MCPERGDRFRFLKKEAAWAVASEFLRSWNEARRRAGDDDGEPIIREHAIYNNGIVWVFPWDFPGDIDPKTGLNWRVECGLGPVVVDKEDGYAFMMDSSTPAGRRQKTIEAYRRTRLSRLRRKKRRATPATKRGR
jgi:hypothetical protein